MKCESSDNTGITVKTETSENIEITVKTESPANIENGSGNYHVKRDPKEEITEETQPTSEQAQS